MPSPLADLDELVLKCRDERALQYIKEAVSCYKSGAFRSAIVSTWIAVTFDLIDKFKELSLLGDKEAEKQVEEIEKARHINDIARFLQLERDIINVARDKLELISHTESIDLERLKEDRNRCAHPSMNLEGDIFNPSAELARLHIHSAVNHLLQYPPSQGKYALDKIILEIESNFFPSLKKDVLSVIRNSPLSKPRYSLLRNFIVVLIKNTLKEGYETRVKTKIYLVLEAIKELHQENYDDILGKDLSRIISTVSDDNLNFAVILLMNVDDSWEYLEESVKVKLNNFVQELPTRHIDYLEDFIDYAPVAVAAKERLNRATMTELVSTVPFAMHHKIIDRMIEIYGNSHNFESANNWVNKAIRHIIDFSPKHVEKIIEVASTNSQIFDSNEYPRLIRAIRSKKIVSEHDLNIWLKKFDMENLVSVSK